MVPVVLQRRVIGVEVVGENPTVPIRPTPEHVKQYQQHGDFSYKRTLQHQNFEGDQHHRYHRSGHHEGYRHHGHHLFHEALFVFLRLPLR